MNTGACFFALRNTNSLLLASLSPLSASKMLVYPPFSWADVPRNAKNSLDNEGIDTSSNIGDGKIISEEPLEKKVE